MAKLRRIIPFGLWPANWGLTGERLALARAEYFNDGEDLERERARILKPEGTELALEMLAIDKKYNKLSAKDADYEAIRVQFPNDETQEYRLARIELDLKYGEISQNEYEKSLATIKEEPWFKIIGGDHRTYGDGTQLSFELDWNDFFVEDLVANGWGGHTDEEIVDSWFSRTCREMLMEDLEQIDEEPMGGAGFARTRKERDGKRTSYS